MIHSGYFNTLKDLVKTKLSDKTFIMVKNEELVHINKVFQQIWYRSHVSQEDGEYICSYIACTVVEELYCTKDGISSSKDDQVENIVFRVKNSSS